MAPTLHLPWNTPAFLHHTDIVYVEWQVHDPSGLRGPKFCLRRAPLNPRGAPARLGLTSPPAPFPSSGFVLRPSCGHRECLNERQFLMTPPKPRMTAVSANSARLQMAPELPAIVKNPHNQHCVTHDPLEDDMRLLTEPTQAGSSSSALLPRRGLSSSDCKQASPNAAYFVDNLVGVA